MAPLRSAGWSNLVVTLAGQALPVVLALVIDPTQVHYRLDLQVLAVGPLARPLPTGVGAAVPRAGGSSLLPFLAGVDMPPTAAESPVTGVAGVRAWSDGSGGMIVRTIWPLLSPAHLEVMAGAGDVRVYRLAERRAALVFYVEGRVVQAMVEGP